MRNMDRLLQPEPKIKELLDTSYTIPFGYTNPVQANASGSPSITINPDQRITVSIDTFVGYDFIWQYFLLSYLDPPVFDITPISVDIKLPEESETVYNVPVMHLLTVSPKKIGERPRPMKPRLIHGGGRIYIDFFNPSAIPITFNFMLYGCHIVTDYGKVDRLKLEDTLFMEGRSDLLSFNQTLAGNPANFSYITALNSTTTSVQTLKRYNPFFLNELLVTVPAVDIFSDVFVQITHLNSRQTFFNVPVNFLMLWDFYYAFPLPAVTRFELMNGFIINTNDTLQIDLINQSLNDYNFAFGFAGIKTAHQQEPFKWEDWRIK